MNVDTENTKHSEFALSPKDIPAIYDVVFGGVAYPLGTFEVIANASPAGREFINRVFPGAKIHWTRKCEMMPFLPSDWLEFSFVMPAMSRLQGHKLPRHLLDAVPIKRQSPDQLAYLMMSAVNSVGGRAAFCSAETGKLTQVRLKEQSQFVTH